MKRYVSIATLFSVLAVSGLAAADVAPKLIYPLHGVTRQHVSPANPGCGNHSNLGAARVAPAPRPAAHH